MTGGLRIRVHRSGSKRSGSVQKSGCRCVERREHDRGPGRHVEATDLVVLDGIPRVERRRWVRPQDLLHDLKRVGQVMQFLQSWCMVSEDGVELLVQPRSDGCVPSTYQAAAMVRAVVSWPAKNMVIDSSRSRVSVMASPVGVARLHEA